MDFRFRKSIKIAPGVRLNVGKKSMGVSVGGKGARLSTNTRTGTRVTVSAPGTGLSYSQKVGGSSARHSSSSHSRANRTPVLPLMEPAQWAALEQGERHGVEVSAHSIEWPSVCACCGDRFAAPPSGKEIAHGVWTTTQKINVFSPSYCANCIAHQDLFRAAWNIVVPGAETVGATGAGAGCLSGCGLWLLGTLLLVGVGVQGSPVFWGPLFIGIIGLVYFVSALYKSQRSGGRSGLHA